MDTRVNSESLVSFYLAHSLTSGAYILGCLQDLEEWKGKASIEYCRPSPQHHELCHMGDRVATSIHSHTRRDHQRITLSAGLLDHNMCPGQLCASPDGRWFSMKEADQSQRVSWIWGWFLQTNMKRRVHKNVFNMLRSMCLQVNKHLWWILTLWCHGTSHTGVPWGRDVWERGKDHSAQLGQLQAWITF